MGGIRPYDGALSRGAGQAMLGPVAPAVTALGSVLLMRAGPASDVGSASVAPDAIGLRGTPDPTSDRMAWSALVGLLVFALIVIRTAPLGGPFVWDEAFYAQQAQFGSAYPSATFSQFPLPNHLFLVVYRVAYRFGAQYMEVARLINAACFAIGAIFLFATARRALPARMAVALAVLGAAGPVASYAATFMPEPLYFLGSWVAIWALTRKIEHSLVRSAAHAGAILGVLMLVKPHALMLLAAFGCYILVFPLLIQRDLPFRRALLATALCVLAFVVAWTIGSFVITGHMALPTLGDRYNFKAGMVLSLAGLGHELAMILFNLSGHLAAMLLLFGAVLYGLCFRVFRDVAVPRTSYDTSKAIAFLAVIVTGITLLVVGKFTAEATKLASSETIERLHGRYYDFLFPLVALAFFAGWERMRPDGTRARALFVAVGIGLAVAAAFWLAGRFALEANDYPDALLLRSNGDLAVVTVGAMLTFAAALGPGKYYPRVVAGVLVCVVILSTWTVWSAQAVHPPAAENLAAEALRRSDPTGDGSRWQVFLRKFDPRMPWVAMALRAPASIEVWSDDRALDCGRIRENTTWLLLLDPIPVDCGFERTYVVPGFTIWRRIASN